MRMEIVSAYVVVTDHPDMLLRVCANMSGDADDDVAAVAAAFEIGEIPARAVLDMQVRRFTPGERMRLRDELEDLQRRLDPGHP